MYKILLKRNLLSTFTARPCFQYSTSSITSKLIYERELRSALSKLERACSLIPDQQQKQKTADDLERFNAQFQDLIFTEYQTDLEQQTQERDLKKLITVARSKFYMLKINFPKIIESIDHEIADSTQKEVDYDPFAKNPNIPEIKQVKPLMAAAVDLNEDESEENKKRREEVIKKDKKDFENLDKATDELIKQMGNLKNLDEMNKEIIEMQKQRKVQYIEREDDAELKEMYDKEQKRFEELHHSLKDKVDGEIDMDMHGNITVRTNDKSNKTDESKGGIQGSGTYVLRDGKLVPGKGETREQAQYSNWYCSNADPEDITRHRELMDRMHYRGPKWEGVGVPKSILEEFDPTYRKAEAEPHPSESHPDKEGKKDFEYVVR